MIATFNTPSVLELGTVGYRHSLQGRPHLSDLLTFSSAISDSPGEIAGIRRLRAALARKLARRLAKAVSVIHDANILHGGTLDVGE